MKLGSGAAVPLIGQLVSGACAGYFLGWTVGLIRRYRAETNVAVALDGLAAWPVDYSDH